MKALRLVGPGELHLDEIEKPLPIPGESLVRVAYSALCRTDAKMWTGGQRDLILPRVLGHEIFGYHEVSGEPVVIWPGAACGTCVFCRSGKENLCPNVRILGFNRDGGLAEWVAVPDESLLPVPATLSGDLACLAEPLACCLNALDQLDLQPGERILIFGAGPVGLLMALAAKGVAAEPSLTEIKADRLLASREFQSRLRLRVNSEIAADSFDAAVNAASSADAVERGLAALRPGGRFCLFSGLSSDSFLSSRSINEVHYRQLTVSGAYGCTRNQMTRALSLLDAHQEVARLLIEREIALEEVPLHLGRIAAGEALKLVVRMFSAP